MLPTVQGFSPRCSWCEQAAGCPKFAGENQPEWADTLQELAELKTKKDSLQGQISAVEESVKYACVNGDALGKRKKDPEQGQAAGGAHPLHGSGGCCAAVGKLRNRGGGVFAAAGDCAIGTCLY